MLKTTEEARQYFKPLTYKDITEKRFNKLVAILEEHLGKWNRLHLEERQEGIINSKYYMTIHPHKRFSKYPGTRYVKDIFGDLKEAFIIVECDRYSKRSGISFNQDGFIGFAGWADSTNVIPFLTAFEEWVTGIKKEKRIYFNLGESIDDCIDYKVGKMNQYYVEEFPENPIEGSLVNKDGCDYVFIHGNWKSLDTSEQMIIDIKQVLDTDLESKKKIDSIKHIIYR